MSRSLVERRLSDVTQRLRKAREELSVVEEQRQHFAETADDLRIRALVAETPGAEKEFREAQKHVDAMDRSRNELAKHIADLQRSQDELLERLVPDAK
jgi:chromosome segregation ATPase